MANGEYQRIVLTGMGSSLFAIYPLHLALTNRCLPSLVVETAELIHCPDAVLDQRTFVVMVSKSGQSAEIVRLLDVAQGRAPVGGMHPCRREVRGRMAATCRRFVGTAPRGEAHLCDWTRAFGVTRANGRAHY